VTRPYPTAEPLGLRVRHLLALAVVLAGAAWVGSHWGLG